MEKREHWGSKFGFILAASGSAVGLGNIWKYPYIAGENGGGAFTLIYLLCILIVGMPIVIGEFVIGRKTQLSPVGAFEKLAPNSYWKWVGMLGVLSAFVILAFYGVVGGWTLRYTFMSLTGGFSELAENPDLSGAVFDNFITNPWNPLFWHFIFMGLSIWVIVHGIKGGILIALEIYSLIKFNDYRLDVKCDNVSSSISKRNKSLWWSFFIYFYGFMDAIVEAHLMPHKTVMNTPVEEDNSEKK